MNIKSFVFLLGLFSIPTLAQVYPEHYALISAKSNGEEVAKFKVWYSDKGERLETDVPIVSMIITQYDNKEQFLLYPQSKTYIEIPFVKTVDPRKNSKYSCEDLKQQETFLNRKVEIWKCGSDVLETSVNMWFDKETGIILKSVDPETEQTTMEVLELKLADQPDELFLIPDDYKLKVAKEVDPPEPPLLIEP